MATRCSGSEEVVSAKRLLIASLPRITSRSSDIEKRLDADEQLSLCELSMEVTNPTIEEIREWAYSEEEWPHDEWDLFMSWTREVDLFIQLATDHKCPKRIFFLHMLYYIVGTTYGEPNKSDKLDRIAFYADKGRGIKHGDIRNWVKNTEELIKGFQKYSYDNWRGGIHAGYNFT